MADTVVPPIIPPQDPPQTATAGNVNIKAHSHVVPNLRNGDPATITQAAPRASIASRYKWAHIAGMTHDRMVAHVDAVIRATYAQLLAGTTTAVTDATRAEARTDAIILGSVRAAAAGAWQLTPADMNAEEVVGSGSNFTASANGRLGSVSAGNGTAGGNYTVATGMTPITPEEVAVINVLMYLGMAVPIMQGISLVLTGHHFLPTTKNHFAGMKRQALQIGGDAVRTWVEALGDRFEDMAFHKACHPISPPTKRAWAKNPDVAVRMVASGHTAAAIRIPALPSDAQGTKAAIAVMVKAAPVIRGMEHNITWAAGADAIRAVETAAEGRAELDAVAAARAWMVAHASQIAFCIGIVQYLSDTSAGGRDTTLSAFSVRKLMTDYNADVSRGSTYARAYVTRMREAAESGRFPDPNIIA
jgi:hypothetical protein